jgi:hypothetical protein
MLMRVARVNADASLPIEAERILRATLKHSPSDYGSRAHAQRRVGLWRPPILIGAQGRIEKCECDGPTRGAGLTGIPDIESPDRVIGYFRNLKRISALETPCFRDSAVKPLVSGPATPGRLSLT